MKTNPTIAKLLGNKTVLYVVSIIALLNVLGYLFYGNITAVVYFGLLGLLVSYFSKNMIIILMVPLILVNFLAGAQQMNNKNVEGMTSGTPGTSGTSGTPGTSGTSGTSGTKNASSTNATTTPSTTAASNTTTLANTTAATTPITPATDSFTGNKGKKGKHSVDYATTISEAYDNLNSVLGSDGIKGLTQDTKRLMQQQQDLAGSMKDIVPLIQSFEPMMEQAKGLLDSMGGIDSIKGLDGIKDIFGKIGNSAQKKDK